MARDSTICLCMIVRDEAPVIERCLRSVRPLIDSWLIVDTGSTDETKAIARRSLADIPGSLHERPWHGFARNRSEALALARPCADYSLIIDADDELILPQGYALPDLRHDAYVVDILDREIVYGRLQLVANRLPWRYEGVLHEYLVCEGAGRAEHLRIAMRRHYDGARHRDPSKSRKDLDTLKDALAVERDPFKRARYTFYLAQSYRDCGEWETALAHYLARADLGFWTQEIYMSLLTAGRVMERLGHPTQKSLQMYERASAACPARIEAVHAYSRLCHRSGDFVAGYEAAKGVLTRPMPPGCLFGEPWIYAYGLAAVLAANAYESGHYRDCIDACIDALASTELPQAERPRMANNLRLALRKLL